MGQYPSLGEGFRGMFKILSYHISSVRNFQLDLSVGTYNFLSFPTFLTNDAVELTRISLQKRQTD